jgi:NADPH-dependent ferric siderophore reductase
LADPATSRNRRPLLTTVQETVRLTPHLIRVVVSGDDLASFAVGRFTDHYVKLQLPPPRAPYAAPFVVEDIKARLPRELWPRTRTYTVRAWDPNRRRLTLDFVYHGDTGIAGPWAAAAVPGDRLQLLGPGGAYAPEPAVVWHLMVGDASVIPAIAASLERVRAGVPVHVLLEVEGPDDHLSLDSPGEVKLRWLHQTRLRPADQLLVLDALRELEFPDGRLQAFVHGEASTVRAVRRHLLIDRGVPKDALSVSGYWKRDRDEEGWRADKAEWNRQAEADALRAA